MKLCRMLQTSYQRGMLDKVGAAVSDVQDADAVGHTRDTIYSALQEDKMAEVLLLSPLNSSKSLNIIT